MFVFDRVTGTPVWPIEERPVPPSDVPGERAWPTQPFPTRPPPFAPQGMSLDDAIDLTPELKAAAQAELKKYRLGPLYTPPSLQGTVMRPGLIGGADWGGGAFDPETGHAVRQDVEHAAHPRHREARTGRRCGSARLVKWTPITCREGRRTPTFMQRAAVQQAAVRAARAIDLNTGTMLADAVGRHADSCGKHPALTGVTLPERLGAPARRAPSSRRAGWCSSAAATAR